MSTGPESLAHVAASGLPPRRNPLLLIAGVALVVLAVVMMVTGIVRLVNEAGPQDEDVLARGSVSSRDTSDPSVVRFQTPRAQTLTIWAKTGSNESVTSGTECELTRADGTRQRIDGGNQGASLTIGSNATVGKLKSLEGTNTVVCRQTRSSASGYGFIVERGSPGDGLRGLWLLLGGIGVVILGIVAIVLWVARVFGRPPKPRPIAT